MMKCSGLFENFILYSFRSFDTHVQDYVSVCVAEPSRISMLQQLMNLTCTKLTPQPQGTVVLADVSRI